MAMPIGESSLSRIWLFTTSISLICLQKMLISVNGDRPHGGGHSPIPSGGDFSRRTRDPRLQAGKTVDEISQALYSSWGPCKFTEEDLTALAASKMKQAQISQEKLEGLASKTGKTVNEIFQALYSSWGTYKFTKEDLTTLAASKNNCIAFTAIFSHVEAMIDI